MKQKVGFLLGIAGLVILVGIVVNIVKNRYPKQGELRVETQPSANVFLDDKPIGRSPIGKTSYQVKAGEYSLKIIPDAGINQLVSWQEKISINPRVLTFVNVTLSESELTSSSYILWLEKITSKKAELSLTTSPDGVTVLFDDEMKGTTPITIPDISPGDHSLRLVSRGYVNREIKMRFNAGYRLLASVKMALTTGGAIVEDEAAKTDDMKSASPSSFISKTSPTQKISPTPKTTTTLSGFQIKIKPNELGFLRVRLEPSKTASETARVKPGDTFTVLDTKNDWYEISYDGISTGWISNLDIYVEKLQ